MISIDHTPDCRFLSFEKSRKSSVALVYAFAFSKDLFAVGKFEFDVFFDGFVE